MFHFVSSLPIYYNMIFWIHFSQVSHYSTRSALLRITNDILLSVDSGNCVVLILLDQSAAFDTVDHNIPLDHLQKTVGLHGTAVEWFRSHLKDRSFTIHIDNYYSSIAPVTCGVPQEFILGPVLFSVYMLPLGRIFPKYNIAYHCYADDTPLWVLSFRPKDIKSVETLVKCLSEVK